MIGQNLANHARYVKGYHFVLSSFLVIGLIASVINIYLEWKQHYDILSSILITWLFIIAVLLAAFVRQFPLKAQDRAIRAEEGLRHFILTSRSIDSKITMQQIIALRFAPDEEFVVLADRAAKENLTPAEIKKEIKNWRADNHRV